MMARDALTRLNILPGRKETSTSLDTRLADQTETAFSENGDLRRRLPRRGESDDGVRLFRNYTLLKPQNVIIRFPPLRNKTPNKKLREENRSFLELFVFPESIVHDVGYNNNIQTVPSRRSTGAFRSRPSHYYYIIPPIQCFPLTRQRRICCSRAV